MIEILHNFFAGITFAVGITVGAVLCRIATKEGRKEMANEVRESHARIEERLLGSLKCHERMAAALAIMARKYDGENTDSAALDYEQWEQQGGDIDGIMRTVCHACDRMWPMAAMTEDARFDNICPSCMAERQNDEMKDGESKTTANTTDQL